MTPVQKLEYELTNLHKMRNAQKFKVDALEKEFHDAATYYETLTFAVIDYQNAINLLTSKRIGLGKDV